MQNPSSPDARKMEETFFAEKNARLLKRLREKDQREEQRASLRETVPNADDAFLDRLLDLGVLPETVLALTLIPLTAVAWADGSVDAQEREAILQAAEDQGVKAGTPSRELLENWLEHQPDAGVVEAWKRYVETIWAAFDDADREQMHKRTIGMARHVAEASGGFLGLTSKISSVERDVLADLESAFDL